MNVRLMNRYPFLALVLIASAFLALSAVATPADGSLVVASQGGQTLSFADIDEAVEKVPAGDRVPFINSPKRIQALIVNLLLQKQLAADATKAGLAAAPEIEAAAPAERTGRLAQAQMEHFRASIQIPDLSGLAQEEYIAHKEQYVAPATFDIQQVLVSTASRSDEAAKVIADEVETQAKSGKVEFDSLVAKYSDEPTKAQTLGIIKHAGKRATQPELEQAVDALLVPGSISPPVRATNGYYVLKLLARTPARQLSFDEARDQILEALKADYVRKTVAAYVDGLRNKPMDVDPDRVSSLRTRYGQLPALPDAAAARDKPIVPRPRPAAPKQ